MKTKITFFSLLFCLMGMVVNAQTEKGTLMLGGTGSMAIGGTKSGLFLFPRLSPNVGYFVADNVAVGVRLGFGADFVNIFKRGQMTNPFGNMNVFGRYYFGISDKLKLPIELSTGFSAIHNEGGAYPTTMRYGAALAGGVNLFLNKNIAFEAMLRYGGSTSIVPNVGGYRGNLSLNLGFQIYLPSKKATPAVH
jgi:hypothetical protein